MQTVLLARRQMILLSLLLVACVGCSTESEITTSGESTAIGESDIAFRFQSLEIFRNNIQLGANDGCITTFTVDESSRQLMTATCGMSKETATTVSWKCVSQSRDEAVFLFQINPSQAKPSDDLESRTVFFTGEDVVVFENKSSRTTLRLPQNLQ